MFVKPEQYPCFAKISLCAVVALCGAFAAQAEDALPVYEVSVSADTRLWLTNAMFNVTTADGTQAVKGDAIDFTGGGTFKKRGAGELVSHLALSGFTGEVRVEEGAIIVYANGHLGKEPGETIVSNGAAVVLMTGKDYCPGPEDFAANDKLFSGSPYRQKFILSGGGTADWPGAVVNAGNSQFYSMSLPVVMSNDTALASLAGRLDIRGTSLTMNGYRLTFRGAPGAQLGFTRAPIYSPGNIDVDAVSFIMEGEPSPNVFEGDATHVLHLMNGAALQRSRSGQAPAWTLLIDAGCSMFAGTYNTTMTEDFNRWLGPVVLNAKVTGVNGTNTWLTFAGPVSGTGGFTDSQKGWLYFKGTNTYEGLTAVDGTTSGSAGSGIRLFCPQAANPSSTNGLKLTNAELRLEPSAEDYDLPKVVFAGAKASALTGAAARIASLRKEGAGVLDLSTVCTITGRTELVAGTMRLPSLADWYELTYGGVMEGSQTFATKATTDGVMGASPFYDSNLFPSNAVSVQRSLRYPYGEAQWGGQLVVEYKGWIWNTNDTDVTWSFFVLAPSRGKLFIDESTLLTQGSWNLHAKANKTLSPGAHSFRLRLYGDNVSSANFRKPQNDGLVWSNNFCVAYDPQGRLTTNLADYVKLDAGDIGLFSRTNQTLAQLVAAGAPLGLCAFDTLELHKGATLDCNMPDGLSNLSLSVNHLAGAGTVTNGNLTIAEDWTLLAENAPATLDVAGTLTFGEECIITAADVDRLPHRTAEEKCYTLYKARAVVGRPVLDDALLDDHWELKFSADGRSCEIFRRPGAIILLR